VGAAAALASRGCVEPAPRARRRGNAVPSPRPAPAGADAAACGPWDGPAATWSAEPIASSACVCAGAAAAPPSPPVPEATSAAGMS